MVSGGKGRQCSTSFPGIYTRIDDPDVFNWIQKTVFGIETSALEQQPSISHKIFVTTGRLWGNGVQTKVIDMKNETFECELPNYPFGVSYAIGGIINGSPMVCGGYKFRNRKNPGCYSLVQGTWQKSAELNTTSGLDEKETGNVIYNGKLLISGGYEPLDSELLIGNQDIYQTPWFGPLPSELSYYCNIQLNSTAYMLTGGYTNSGEYSRETMIYNFDR